MIARTAVVIAMLLGAAAFGARAAGSEMSVPRESLSTLPYEIGDWRGREATPFTGDVVAQLGVDDYIHRTYLADGGRPIGLYAGYYGSQRQGDTIHSPQNCLPGAGWRPVESSIIAIDVNGRSLPVNRYVIQKGLERVLVVAETPAARGTLRRAVIEDELTGLLIVTDDVGFAAGVLHFPKRP